MKKYSKTFNTNIIKTNISYSVIDIVELLGVTKGTVYSWIKEGLKPIDDNTPYLIHASELKRFIKHRQKKRKHKCKEGEMFCFKCQQPRRAIRGRTPTISTKGRNPILQDFAKFATRKCTRFIVVKTRLNQQKTIFKKSCKKST